MTDLANHTAAVAAGYARVQCDHGSGAPSPRYESRYEKPMQSAGGYLEKATGQSNSAQATADTAALNALNGQRAVRYGTGSTANRDGAGNSLTFDA